MGGVLFKYCLIIFLLTSVSVPFVLAAENPAFLGSSLYFSPLQENPRAGSNFTLTIRVDSLEKSINAISGKVIFNPDKLEIINTSKIGSIFNLWLEEPNYSNLEGRLSFQGGADWFCG